MEKVITTELYKTQPFCSGIGGKRIVYAEAMKQIPTDPGEAGLWTKVERNKRSLSAQELAERINGIAAEQGDPTVISQQVLSKWERGRNKKTPPWTRFIVEALANNDSETKEDAYLTSGLRDDSVGITLLPTFAGLGSGGTGDDDEGIVQFSRDLIERELRANPDYLLAMMTEGNSMEPHFMGGDQILVDTRRKSLAQPGAFCIWDGDGHVIKYLEKVPNSDPAMIRVISANELYESHNRLAEEINLIGRVIWFGRRIF